MLKSAVSKNDQSTNFEVLTGDYLIVAIFVELNCFSDSLINSRLENNLKIRVYVLALLALSMASFLLINFGLIWAYGRFYIYESNALILIMETTLIVAILAFSFYCLVEALFSRKTETNHLQPTGSHIISPERHPRVLR